MEMITKSKLVLDEEKRKTQNKKPKKKKNLKQHSPVVCL